MEAMATYNQAIASLRKTEYPQLQTTTYLDHAGTTLYANSLIDAFAADLRCNLLGNPHSASPSSDLSTTRVNTARRQVLEYFQADPEYFDVIFTQNATAAIKLVLHSFERRGFNYGYYRDSHTSIVGVRETALHARYFGSRKDVEDWIETGASLLAQPDMADAVTSNATNQSPVQLFAYPAQSNMNGHRPPLRWCQEIRSCNNGNQTTYVLLDAASYLTTGRLDFSNPEAAPDFTSLSFYKIFGFPDLGALIVRKSSADVLNSRQYFGGGTVEMIISSNTANESFHALKTSEVHERFEDGTLPFHNIAALSHALKIQKKLFGSPQEVSQHVTYLGKWLYDELSVLRHANGQPVVVIYKDPDSEYGNSTTQGSILAFNFMDSEGKYVGKTAVENLAISCGIQIRTGGVCNPGGIATMLDLLPWELRRNFTEGLRCGNNMDVLGGKPTGIVRVSLGAMSTLQDVQTFAQFVQKFFIESTKSTPQSILRQPASLDVPSDSGYDSLSENGVETPVDEASKLSRPMITPIQGLKPAKVIPTSPSGRSHIKSESVSSWNNRWGIIRTDDASPIPASELSQANLNMTIFPEKGSFHFRNESDAQELNIDLWSPPDQSHLAEVSDSAPADDKPALYNDPAITKFFTSSVGVPCTLGHYRSMSRESIGKDGHMCVVASCSKQFNDNKALSEHINSVHAKEFEAVLAAALNQPCSNEQTLETIPSKRRSRMYKWFSMIKNKSESISSPQTTKPEVSVQAN